MITTTNITVYRCEFCKKKLFRKHAMEHHEKFCNSNPANKKACSGCVHLKEIEIDYEAPYYSYDQNSTIQAKGFRCEKLDKILYPTIVERRGLPQRYPDTFEGQEPMPKECEHFNMFI